MKKRLMIIVAALALIALAMMGCQGKEGGEKTPQIVGKWSAAAVESAGVSVDYKTYADQLKSTGVDATMELEAKEDGKFTMSLMGQSLDGTWKEDGDQYVLTMNGADQEVSVADGKLTFEYADMGVKIIFEK